jgi:hypothetical protein
MPFPHAGVKHLARLSHRFASLARLSNPSPAVRRAANVNAPARVRERSRDGSNASRCRCAWQFLFRAAALITRLTLMLIVDVRGVAYYVAWTLIAVALASEATATLAYWLRSWRGVSALGACASGVRRRGAGAHVAPRPPSASATGRP